MNIELTNTECQNVKGSLLVMAKRSDVNEDGMKMLLLLADKFNTPEEKPEKKPDEKWAQEPIFPNPLI